MTTGDDQPGTDGLEQLCQALGLELDEWQLNLLRSLTTAPASAFTPEAMAMSARRTYKAEAHRRMVQLALAAGEHVHIVEAGGELTCANETCTEDQLKPPKRAPELPLRVYFDEAQRLGPSL